MNLVNTNLLATKKSSGEIEKFILQVAHPESKSNQSNSIYLFCCKSIEYMLRF